MRLVMMGTGTFAEPTFSALIEAARHPVVGLVTQPDRAAGAERGSTRQTGKGMKTIALEQGIPVLQPESINTPEGMDGLRALQPDLVVVAAYGQILSKDVLGVPTHGGINVHASLLPKYRGAAPIAWAIYHGEKETGVTVIRMSPFLDAGEMLARESLEIRPDETAGELEARLAPFGARMALKVIEQIASGTTQPITQDKTQVTKAPKLTKEHGLIDWNRSAEQVCNHIRAMQPWPTAYTYLHRPGKPPVRVIITRAVPHPIGHPATLPAGTLYSDSDFTDSLFVVAGEVGVGRDLVVIGQLQPSGKRRMEVIDFLRGNHIESGARFGPETP